VVAATNKDIRKEIDAGRFREDLYHRLAVIIIQVPSLNDRKGDIPLLAEHFIESVCNEYGRPRKQLTPEAVRLLQEMDWTGNIRELRNVVERLIILSDQEITGEDVQAYVAPTMKKANAMKNLFDEFDDWESLRAFMEVEFKKYKNS
jgi:DNA-binding NtrC family response regulator